MASSIPLTTSHPPSGLRVYYPESDLPRPASPAPPMSRSLPPRVFEFVFEHGGESHLITLYNREAWAQLHPAQRPAGAQQINEGAWAASRPLDDERTLA